MFKYLLLCIPILSFSQDFKLNINNNPAWEVKEWNNWKPFNQCGINIPSNKYGNIQLIMNCQTGLGENGISWPSIGDFSKEVSREYSYSSSSRTITINGLNDDSLYDIWVLCSSNRTNDISIFSLNSQSDTIKNNPGGVAFFSDGESSRGTIRINVSNIGKYNYWNGLIINEKVKNRNPILELKDTTMYFGGQFDYFSFIGYDLDGDTVMYKMTKIADTDSVFYTKGWPAKGPYFKLRMWDRKSTYKVIAEDGKGGKAEGEFTITWVFDPKRLLNILPLGGAGLLYVYADGSMEIKKPE